MILCFKHITSIIIAIIFNECAAQIPLDSISFERFERDKISNINYLRKAIQTDDRAWLKVKLAKDYWYVNHEDSAVKYYDLALAQFEQEGDIASMRKVLPSIITNITSQKNTVSAASGYRNVLNELSKNMKAYNRYAVFLKKLVAKEAIKNNQPQKALRLLYTLKNNFNPNDSLELYSSILINLAHCKQLLSDKDSADYYARQALKFIKKNKEFDGYFRVYLRLGNLKMKEAKYDDAIRFYDSSNMFIPEKCKLKCYRSLYEQYNKVYKAKGDPKRALAYLEAENKIAEITNELEQNRIIAEIDTKHNLKQAQTELGLQEELINNYKSNKLIYIIGFIMILLVLFYAMIKWQGELTHRKRMEVEQLLMEEEKKDIVHAHENSKKQINKLKSLIEKEHIVLKNKSKVALDDLMYIKSDGHYLALFTTHNNEFVRGKMSAITQELPPNFIQCHRSYTVNKNFIQRYQSNKIYLNDGMEIPVSRKFKDRLNGD